MNQPELPKVVLVIEETKEEYQVRTDKVTEIIKKISAMIKERP